jgi:hypothetical protein
LDTVILPNLLEIPRQFHHNPGQKASGTKEMKTIFRLIIVMGLLAGLFTAQIARGQGSVTYVSNLEQASAGVYPLGGNSWLAALFATGSNAGGYGLDSVQLGMADALSGSPGSFTVMIYSRANSPAVSPGSSLATLVGSADPATAGEYTYTPTTTLMLTPGTFYFIVVNSTMTAGGGGAYEWSDTGADNYNPIDGWSAGGSIASMDGTIWGDVPTTSGFLQFAINATPAPEPGVVGLLAVGALAFGLLRRNEKSHS